MAKSNSERKSVSKRTSQGGTAPRTSGFNKTQKNSVKPYRGQGR